MFLSTFVKAKLLLEEFKNDERGVTAIEYALVAVAIAAIVGVVFGSTGGLDEALDTGMATLKAALD